MKRAASMNRVEGAAPIEEQTGVMLAGVGGGKLRCDYETVIEEED